MAEPIKNPLLVGASKGFKQHTNNVQPNNTANFRNGKMFKKIINRDALPVPLNYYHTHFSNLPQHIDREWSSVLCCFHDDKNPSLSINLRSGGFYCFGCGAKGGDVIAFHMLRYGMPFTAVVTFFGAWTYEQ
jgi:hypothetical protein